VKWIDVQDERPEIGTPVLCACPENFTQMAQFMGTDYYPDEPTNAHIFLNEYDDFISISHWMKIPDKPKEEKD
jgi:hypothetical protein